VVDGFSEFEQFLAVLWIWGVHQSLPTLCVLKKDVISVAFESFQHSLYVHLLEILGELRVPIALKPLLSAYIVFCIRIDSSLGKEELRRQQPLVVVCKRGVVVGITHYRKDVLQCCSVLRVEHHKVASAGHSASAANLLS
jgi:hypothetical protein